MNKQELGDVLRKHDLWLKGEDDGDHADLSYADLSYANLRSADLRYANLRYADLRYADLRSADLRSANLRYANLRYANLRSAKNIIVGPQRTDGHQFFLIKQKSSWHVIAGCRDMTIKAYRKHVQTYGEAEKGSETNRILDYLEGRMADILRGDGE